MGRKKGRVSTQCDVVFPYGCNSHSIQHTRTNTHTAADTKSLSPQTVWLVRPS